MELSSLFPFFFLKKMLSTFLCTTLTQILCVVHMAHRSLFCRICTEKPCCDSKLTASVSILTAVWIHGHDSMLSLLVLPDSSSLLLIRVPSCSSDVPIVFILVFGTNTKYAHTKFLGFWRLPGDSGIQGFLVQYPEHIAPTPVHILTLKTVFTAPPKWSFWSHSVFNLIVSFISQQLPFYSFSFLRLRIACISSFLTFSF